jgi:hypothetical protein
MKVAEGPFSFFPMMGWVRTWWVMGRGSLMIIPPSRGEKPAIRRVVRGAGILQNKPAAPFSEGKHCGER